MMRQASGHELNAGQCSPVSALSNAAFAAGDDMDLAASRLLTDLYQLNMIQAYLDHGETTTAVFEFFVRKLPTRRGFLVAAGLEQALDFLEGLRFSPEELDWLKGSGRFDEGLLDVPRRSALHRRRARHARGHGLLCQ